VAQALGVSEASLKRWCDKGLLNVVRTAGGHRRLPINGVMQFIRQQGHEIVRPEVLVLPPATCHIDAALDRVRDLIRAALEAGDGDRCRRLLFNLYLSGHPTREICDKVIAPAFHDIGDRWSHGDVEVYEERRGVEICMRALYELRAALPTVPADAPVAFGATLEGDPYTLPTTMVEVALREDGWQAMSYGIGHPAETLCAAFREVRPRLFWLSASAVRSEAEFLPQYHRIYAEAADCGVAVAVGGRALTDALRREMRFSAHCDTIGHLIDFAATLKTGGQSPA